MENLWFPIEKVAEFLGVDLSIVRSLIGAGKLASKKEDNAQLISGESLSKLVSSDSKYGHLAGKLGDFAGSDVNLKGAGLAAGAAGLAGAAASKLSGAAGAAGDAAGNVGGKISGAASGAVGAAGDAASNVGGKISGAASGAQQAKLVAKSAVLLVVLPVKLVMLLAQPVERSMAL